MMTVGSIEAHTSRSAVSHKFQTSCRDARLSSMNCWMRGDRKCCQCSATATSDHPLYHCKACKKLLYCSRTCQEAHWKRGHWSECISFKEPNMRRSQRLLEHAQLSHSGSGSWLVIGWDSSELPCTPSTAAESWETCFVWTKWRLLVVLFVLVGILGVAMHQHTSMPVEMFAPTDGDKEPGSDAQDGTLVVMVGLASPVPPPLIPTSPPSTPPPQEQEARPIPQSIRDYRLAARSKPTLAPMFSSRGAGATRSSVPGRRSQVPRQGAPVPSNLWTGFADGAERPQAPVNQPVVGTSLRLEDLVSSPVQSTPGTVTWPCAEGRYDSSSKHADWWRGIGTWKRYTQTMYCEVIDKETVYVGVGEWIGNLALLAASKAKHAYALEPDPLAFEALKKNAEANPSLKETLSVLPTCIANEAGKLRLSADGSSGAVVETVSQLFHQRSSTLSADKIQTVDCQTLPSVLSELGVTTDTKLFLKVDVEGLERFLLPAWEAWLSTFAEQGKPKPTLALSYHAPQSGLSEALAELEVHARLLNKWKHKYIQQWNAPHNTHQRVSEFTVEMLKGNGHMQDVFVSDRQPLRSST